MELSGVNLQVKTSVKDVPSKTAAAKDNENSFSKVYKEVSYKTITDTDQTKTDAAKFEKASVDQKQITSNLNKSFDEKPEDDTLKNDTDLSNLIEQLLMSQGINQNLISLLNSKDSTNTSEIKDLITKILMDKVEGTNLESSKEINSGASSINEMLKMLLLKDKSVNEDSNILAINQSDLNETIDKLAATIVNKLTTDKTFKENALSELLQKAEEPSITDNNSTLKELIIKQLKSMGANETSSSNNKNTSNSLKENKITTAAAIKENIPTNELNSSISNTAGNNNASSEDSNLLSSGNKTNIAASKLYDASSDKEDKLLKQLTVNDSSKGTMDNVSDKIVNVLNRFETLKLDNQPIAQGKLTINKATLNEDFIKAVKFMDVNNLKELSVKIIPKDLGEVVIRLSMENGVMKANITAANKDTYNLLNSQLPAINSELAKQNMTIQNFSLSLYNGDNFLFSGDGSSNGNGKQQNKNGIKVDNLEEDLQKENYIEDNSTVNLLA